MKFRRTTHFLLALAFAVGQWFAVVHGTNHELSDGDKLVACEVCAVGHAAAPGPAPAGTLLAALPQIEAPLGQPDAAPAGKPLYRPPTRGPPMLLV